MGPDIQYVRSGGVAIAYGVVGEGEVDLAYVPDYVSNLVYDWEYPRRRDFYERLARSFRLILFDKRGTGLSDHGGQFATLETRMEDLHSVLDAVGSSNTVVFAAQEGCGMASLFAASYPERTRSLVLFHPEWAGGKSDEGTLQELAELRVRWGTTAYSDYLLEATCPTLAANEDDRRWFGNSLRVGASPEVAYALNRAFFETDLRDVWPAVRVPTLVLYREPFESSGLEVASRIPGGRPTRISGTDYAEIFLSPEVVEEIERFVAGEEPAAVPDTVLATVMFTDIVGSTERAAAMGDRAWRDLLERHHALVRRELGRYRGKERDTAGDGFFATFDGPARAIRAAHAIISGINELGLEARIGIHVGECELHDDKVAGIAVNIGARVAAIAAANETLASQTVRDLVAGSGIAFDDRGSHQLKGIPGTWQLFAANAG